MSQMPALSPDLESIRLGARLLRRRIHENPETAFEEFETSRLVAERMRARGLPVRTGLGKTGVAALLDAAVADDGDKPGPTLLLRADLDALRLTEVTGLAFASRNGKMHACGHDGHVAALDAAADLLLLDPPQRGRVVFCFQPGEEGAGGARAMIEDGVLDSPRPDRVFGIHLWNSLPLGTIGIAPGPVMATVDEFHIEVRGPGGHAASPHETRDTVVAAAQVVLALQTLVSRRISPLEPAVVSVTSIQGGSAFNIIPSRVLLSGTCRSFDSLTAERLPGLLEATAIAAAATVGCTVATTYRRANGALVNDPREAERCARVARRLGLAVSPDCRTMGGEDFCEFLDRVPGSFAFVGAAPPDRAPGPAHHAPDFDFDERALDIAADLLAAFARDVLHDPSVVPAGLHDSSPISLRVSS
jgi:amidohydrolase